MKIYKHSDQDTEVLYNLSSQVIANGINFITILLFTRLLTTEGYGILTVYTALTQIITIIVGLQTQGTIGTARVHIPQKEYKMYISNISILSLISSSLLFALYPVYVKTFSSVLNIEPLIFILAILQSIGLYFTNLTHMIYIYNKCAKKAFFLNLILALLTTLFSVIFVKLINNINERYWGRLLGLSLPYVSVGIVLIKLLLKDFDKKFLYKHWIYCLKISLPLVFHGISQVAMSQISKLIMQSTVKNVGVYGFAITFSTILHSIWVALNNSWVPYYYDYLKGGKYDIIKFKTRKYLFLFTTLTIGFIFLSPEVVKLLSPEVYWNSVDVLPLLSLNVYFIFLYSFPVNFEFYSQKTKFIAMGSIISAIINILLNIILIKYFDVIGASVATLLSYIFLFLFHHINARIINTQKILNTESGQYTYKFTTFIPWILGLIIACLIYYLFIEQWYIRWIIGLILGIALFVRIIQDKALL